MSGGKTAGKKLVKNRLNAKEEWYQQEVLLWYRRNKRDLPWRKTNNPYHIVLSEIMSQQTQIERVLIFYKKWLKKFPTWEACAKAEWSEILQYWAGLGYNRRAQNLHRCAKEVVRLQKEGNPLPKTAQDWQEMPGIGPYTAHAVAAFALNKPVATVDTNIERIQHRVFEGPEVPVSKIAVKQAWVLAQKYYPVQDKKHKYWNNALMDIGASICTKRNSKCQECPLKKRCKAKLTIHEEIKKYYKAKKKPIEPSRKENGKEIPNRIFRGRLLRVIQRAGAITLDHAGEVVKEDYTDSDREWLQSIAKQLMKEEMIIQKGRTLKIR